jgi:hypothetical protein
MSLVQVKVKKVYYSQIPERGKRGKLSELGAYRDIARRRMLEKYNYPQFEKHGSHCSDLEEYGLTYPDCCAYEGNVKKWGKLRDSYAKLLRAFDSDNMTFDDLPPVRVVHWDIEDRNRPIKGQKPNQAVEPGEDSIPF